MYTLNTNPPWASRNLHKSLQTCIVFISRWDFRSYTKMSLLLPHAQISPVTSNSRHITVKYLQVQIVSYGVTVTGLRRVRVWSRIRVKFGSEFGSEFESEGKSEGKFEGKFELSFDAEFGKRFDSEFESGLDSILL